MDDRTQRYFEDHASKFDSIYHEGQPLSRLFNRLLRKAIYERFAITMEQAEPIQGKTVLDVGCGSGRYSVEFALRGAAAVVGVDYASNMLALAAQYAAAKGVADRCRFVNGDFTSASIDDKYDVVLAIGVFDYQDKPGEFLRRMAERSRGKVIGSFPGRSLIRMPMRKLRYWWDDCPLRFYTEKDVRAVAAAANLKSFDIIPIRSSGTGFMLVGHV